MINDWIVQFYQFALFALLGLVVSIIYKVLTFFHENARLKLVLDVLFGILLVVLVVSVSYVFVLGQFRLYYLVGLVLGVYLAQQTLYAPLDNLKEFLYNQLNKRGKDESDF